MALNWIRSEYFSMLINSDKRSHAALEMMVDDLHADKEKTISKFLCHSGSEDFLWGLVRLLGNKNARVAGNAAYILGTLAESEFGCNRVIHMTSKNGQSSQILADLTNMLTFEDAESVMNAAGTMGTLAESHEGRTWMLSEPCLSTTIGHITELLKNENLWTASNAALVLARLTISESGCDQLLNHDNSDYILSRLVNSLGVDEAGRGMNAAFAIGRMCDLSAGRKRLLSLPESEKMITSLAKMLCCTDTGSSKNACFALSCLATNKDGHHRLLRNSYSDEVIRMLTILLSAEDTETGWFAAMTLRTLASQPKGCLRLRGHTDVIPALKSIEGRSHISSDLMEEVITTLSILKKLEKPPPPSVEVLGSASVNVTWDEVPTKCGFPVSYQIYNGSRCVYSGSKLSVQVDDLHPYTQYNFRLRSHTEGDDSPLSESIQVTTDESVPEAPQNIRVLGATTTQLKIGWEPPENVCGNLKGYYVFNGKCLVEHTMEHCSIISGLQPNTAYDIHVCASTAKGKGQKLCVMANTTELGAHAPSRPEITVRGRNEMYVSWKPPEVPLGRITRYDLCMNGKVVFSGTEQAFAVRRLTPDTEYTFVVSAITSEGKCESKSAKKRTAKDEYEGERAPLYKPPPKKEPDKEVSSEPALPKSSVTKRRRTQESEPAASVKPPVRTNSASSSKHAKNKENKVAQVLTDPIKTTETSRPNTASGGIETTPKEKSSKTLPLDTEPSPLMPAWQKTLRSYTSLSIGEKISMKASVKKSAELDMKSDRPRRPSKSLKKVPHAKVAKSQDNDPEQSVPDTDASIETGPYHVNEIFTVDVQHRSPKEERGDVVNKARQSQNVEGSGETHNRGDGRRLSIDADPAWIAHTQKYNNQDITRMFTTAPTTTMYTINTPKNKPGYIELDLPSGGASGKVSPGLGQRANTVIGTRTNVKREKLPKNTSPPLSHQWNPDFPVQSDKKVWSRNKFVPMQFRTQPLNLPGSIRKEATSLALVQDRGRRPDGLSRSQTEIDFNRSSNSIGSNFSLSSQRLTKERLISAKGFPSQLDSISPAASERKSLTSLSGSRTKSSHSSAIVTGTS